MTAFDILIAELSSLEPGVVPLGSGKARGVFILRVDDVEFALEQGRGPGNLVSVYCKFGRPTGGSGEVARLMRDNLQLASTCSGSFCMAADTEDVLYVFHAPLMGLSCAQLLRVLRQVAAQASAWRERQTESATAGAKSSSGDPGFANNLA